MTMSSSKSNIDDKIAALGNLSRDDLVAQWIKIYKCLPPKSVKRGLLERAAAYRLQARRYGKLKPETHKALLTIASGAHHKQMPTQSALKPGTRLVREWHGKPYQVNVTNTGFDWDGREYTSLSAIAKAITGTKWSGPRFFGL